MKSNDTFEVTVQRDFPFPAERVFDAWLDEDLVGHWFAPELGDMVRVEIDARVGGRFRLDQQRAEGIARHWGEYRQIDRPRRLVFTWCVDENEAESLVTMNIEPRDRGCRLRITHRIGMEHAKYRDRVHQGWSRMSRGVEDGLRRGPFGRRTDAATVCFERLLPGPVERVWAWLADSDKRARWLAAGDLPERPGGRFRLDFHHAGLSPETAPTPERFRAMDDGVSTTHRLLELDPPQRLAMTWDEGEGEAPSEVTFELAAEGDQVRLTITHRRLPRRLMANVAGGWHAHLAILTDKLAGRPPQPFWPVFEELEAIYTRIDPSPAT